MKASVITAAILAAFGLFFRFALIGYVTIALCLFAAAALVLLFGWLKKKQAKRLRAVLLVLVCLGLALLIAVEIPIIKNARTDAEPRADYLIVLGAGVNGHVPSLSLHNRLTAAQDYLESYPDAVAIVTGGQGPGEDSTEAEVMTAWLISRGIAPERVVQEPLATSTEENLRYSMEIIRGRGEEDPRIAIVSSEYHLYRAKCMAQNLGVADPVGVAGRTTYPVLKINYFLREAFAVLYMWVFG